MVSGQNIAASVVLLVGIAGIFTWMKKNNLTTDTISLLDACNGALADEMVNVETCTDIEQQGTTWDTQTPCLMGFKEDKYYWTYRQAFELTTDGKWGSGLLAAALQCAELAKADPDLEAFKSGEKFSVLVGRSEKRALWGWRRRRRGPPPCRDWHARSTECKPLDDWKGVTYRSCSIHLALEKIGLGDGIDYADCSGTVANGATGPDNNYCWVGYYNGRNGFNRAKSGWRKSRLAAACIEHDACLSYGFHGDSSMNENCGGCDTRLSGSALLCTALNVMCADNLGAAGTVAAAMVFRPNGGKPHKCAQYFEAGK